MSDETAFVPDPTGSTFDNPVLSGFHADPSVCRVGDDYYVANSSFEYFPGVPIYHSRDLVNFRLVGHALTRESQLPLAGQKSSKGIFAPTLRYHDGTFYLITTNIENGGNFYVHTQDPAGEWSEPIWVKNDGSGMDPSLFFDDDGTVYYTRHGGGEHGGIYQAPIDLATGALLETPRLIWSGTGGIWPEGPHLYKINGLYYLLISEGGTSYEHSLTVARAVTPNGPFEAYSKNPILTHSNAPSLAIQATGHGDLVQTQNGSWWMVLLGIRPIERRHHIGRETMLTPVSWTSDNWPQVNNGAPLALRMDRAGLPTAAPWPKEPVRDDFIGPLRREWTFVRSACGARCSTQERPGYLRLKGTSESLSSIGSPTFAGQPQRNLRMRVSTELEFTPNSPPQVAGLALRQDESNHYTLLVTGYPERKVVFSVRARGATTERAAVAIPAGPVRLSIEAFPDHYTFSYSTHNEAPVQLGEALTQPLASEWSGSFTGVFVGLYASSGAGPDMPPADFAWFDYEALGR